MHTHHFFRRFSLFHRALGNERRVYALYLLWTEGPQTGTELTAKLGIHPSAVSRHLHVLLKADIIQGQRKGMEVVFSIRPTSEVVQIMRIIEELTF